MASLDFKKSIYPLFEKSCFECHGQNNNEGELDLQSLLTDRPLVKNRRRWINIYQQARNHVMPPVDARQPSNADRRIMVAWIHDQLFNFDYSQTNNPGFEKTRRLTHLEYANTLRDLFDFELDIAARLPTDLSASSGFDNSDSSLFLQPLLMEKYVQVAELVSDSLAARYQAGQSRTPFFELKPTAKLNPQTAFSKNLKSYLPLLFRRPASEEELAAYSKLFAVSFEKNKSFVKASQKVLQAILVSPNFLFRIEKTPRRGREFRVSDIELANRLSYFIWTSMPDRKLLDSALNGDLSTPDGIQNTTLRLLADEKSKALGDIFGSQWLGYQHLGTRIRADPIDNPWCTDSLMYAMKQETSRFLQTLIRENRPVSDLLHADFTFVNEELAKFYGMRGIKGVQMQKVKAQSQRRGLLGQASILAVTSHPYQTSPVKRGTWIMTEVLGTPPPPPPPGASEFKEDIEENDRLSFRQKLARHSKDQRCASCHQQIDPLGFGLERFDWFGRYRKRRVDDAGQLPDGTQFRGLNELNKVLIAKNKESIARNFIRKLLSYSLARQLEYYDEKTVNEILKKTSPKNYPMRDIVLAIVQSHPFQYKKRPSSNP